VRKKPGKKGKAFNKEIQERGVGEDKGGGEDGQMKKRKFKEKKERTS